METPTVWLKGRISSDGAKLFTGMRLKAVAALNGSFAGIWVVAAFEASSDNPNSNPNQGKFRFMHQLFSSSGTAYILDCNWLQLFNHGQVDLNTCCKHCTYVHIISVFMMHQNPYPADYISPTYFQWEKSVDGGGHQLSENMWSDGLAVVIYRAVQLIQIFGAHDRTNGWRCSKRSSRA